MSELRKTTPDDLYFVTLTIVEWVDLLSRSSYKNILIDNLSYCQENEELEIYSYVITTNHLHMICRRKNKDLKELLGRFKSFTSKQMLKAIESNSQESRKDWLLQLFSQFAKTNKQYKYHLWDYTDFPVFLHDNKIIDQKRDYIHQNPVKAGIITEAHMYLYSSACPDSPLKVCEL